MFVAPLVVAAAVQMPPAGRALPAEAAPPALAVLFLAPAPFGAAPEEPLTLTLRTGEGAEAAWPGVSWVFIRVAGTQQNFDALPRDERAGVSLTPGAAGVGLVGIDFAPRDLEVSSADLRAFIRERGRAGGAGPALEGEGLAALRHLRSVAAVFRAGAPGEERGASEATGKTGQRAEIRPLLDPAASAVGGDVAVRVYVEGASVPGARIIATCGATGRRQESAADGSGIGRFTLTDAGPWRVEFHELRAGEGGGPWLLYSGTLAFEVGAGGAAGAGAAGGAAGAGGAE